MKKGNTSKRNRLNPFVGSGASSHSNKERVADDFYSMDSIAYIDEDGEKVIGEEIILF